MPVKKTPRIRYLIMTNKLKSFPRSAVIEIGLSDFHKMTLAIMKKHFVRKMANIVNTAILKSSEIIYSEKTSQKTYHLKIFFSLVVIAQSCGIFFIDKHLLKKVYPR